MLWSGSQLVKMMGSGKWNYTDILTIVRLLFEMGRKMQAPAFNGDRIHDENGTAGLQSKLKTKEIDLKSLFGLAVANKRFCFKSEISTEIFSEAKWRE